MGDVVVRDDRDPRPRVLLAAPLDEVAEQRLAAAAVVVRAPGNKEDALRSLIGDCDAIVARTNTPITRRVLEAGQPRLRIVGVAGVGLDLVDVDAAREFGVRVVNRATAAPDAVAEFTVALILTQVRPYEKLQRGYRAGEFDALRRGADGRELGELTVGIIGMGNIGVRVGRICAAGFGATVLYHDIREIPELPFAARAVAHAEIWSACDVVTLHVPLTPATRGMVNRSVLSAAVRRPILINTARGGVVHTDDLTEALKKGWIFAAALDVTEPEPLPADHPLRFLPNCAITPHVASRSVSGMRRMFDVVDDVIEGLANRTNSGNPALDDR
ncbi:MAG: 2-hydroxyacid dehydrogenase [Phycisphaerae bacterium]